VEVLADFEFSLELYPEVLTIKKNTKPRTRGSLQNREPHKTGLNLCWAGNRLKPWYID
jgi:hypothetical protein